MHLRLVFRFLAPAILCAVRLCHPAAADKLLFDFQGAADLKAWSQFLPDSPQVPGAKDQFWKETHGSDWDGEDPDFLPIFAAYGPSQGTTNVWDFTQAVKWWTGGKHPNYGYDPQAGNDPQSVASVVPFTPFSQGLNRLVLKVAKLDAASGQAFSYRISALHAPKSFAAAGLPTGLSINPVNAQFWINTEITVDRDRRPTSASVCLSTAFGPNAQPLLAQNQIADRVDPFALHVAEPAHERGAARAVVLVEHHAHPKVRADRRLEGGHARPGNGHHVGHVAAIGTSPLARHDDVLGRALGARESADR